MMFYKISQNNTFFIVIVTIAYAILTVFTVNNCFFWDNIQQTSKEAHWFYCNGFDSILMPVYNSGSEIFSTGYHPPLMGLMTAALWKIFGYSVTVSHLFMVGWLVLLLYNLTILLRIFISKKYLGWVLLIVMFEPTVLSQYAIASPDFILFTAFVSAITAILKPKPIMLSISIFFLFGISMRGVFAGSILLLVHLIYSFNGEYTKVNVKSLLTILYPYIPTIIILFSYYVYYFMENGWFFTNSAYSSHYTHPTSLILLAKHFAEFAIRNIENGRFFVWILAIYIIFKIIKANYKITTNEKFIILLCFLLFSLYVVFIFMTQMPFSARYFLPCYSLLCLIVLIGLEKYFSHKTNTLLAIIILLFEITGNFWIYPDQIAKSWDVTLGHLPYYKLRSECFKYIDDNKIAYTDIASGFCLYGNRRYTELIDKDQYVGDEPTKKYFIYSNISNVEDSLACDLANKKHWIKIIQFEQKPVFISIFKRVEYYVK